MAVLTILPQVEAKPYVEALYEGLKELGWVEGRNLIIDVRYSDGDAAQIRTLTTELLMFKPDVFFSATDIASRAAAESADPPPIVFAIGNDPVGSGLVKSLAHPGIRATGYSIQTYELSSKRLALLKEAVPTLNKVGLLVYREGQPGTQLAVLQYSEAAEALGIGLLRIRVDTPEELELAFENMAKQGIHWFLMVANAWFIQGPRLQQLDSLALKYRSATCAFATMFADTGQLMSYSTDYFALFRRSAGLIDRILKGADPANIPIEQASTYELVLNHRTARTIGVTFPNSLLLQATRVIE
ncbi:ABC transporter substrate-binding protein [Variovorax sp. dw_954]|uniref:ABC transporter substrate-binding protein n=1 Tax=Variovorax sp. dw_954 TaxID=2720078 RepID=UPI001BD42BB9|nr:ABC transporter substrate-binding protein [Variovorax sp. dw_954]